MKTQKVTIGSVYADPNQGISAKFCFPEDFESGKKYPAIICAHPIGTARSKPRATSMPRV